MTVRAQGPLVGRRQLLLGGAAALIGGGVVAGAIKAASSSGAVPVALSDTAGTPALSGDFAGKRILFVHAHPDDEAIYTGATMAAYVALGARVTLVTATSGEGGEVLDPTLRRQIGTNDAKLAKRRRGELAASTKALGVTDHRILGGVGRYPSSGPEGDPKNETCDCFWRANIDKAAAYLVAIVRETRPQVVVTYDEEGAYGHPDHIQTNRVTGRALELAADATYRPKLGRAWNVPKLYYTLQSHPSMVFVDIPALQKTGDVKLFGTAPPTFQLPEGTTATVNAAAYRSQKVEALRAHATQIVIAEPWYATAGGIGVPISGVEHYRLARGRGEPGETDLFAGL